MARKIRAVGKGEGGRGPLFVLLLLLLLYGLYSGIIAWQTLDRCGHEESPKHWRFYPPGWVCER